MPSLLADSPPGAPAGETPSGGETPPAGQAPPNGRAPAAADARTAAGARTCGRCGAEMAAGQDWCLACGAGAPGSLGAPGWRPAATALVVVAALALGAAAAAYAALSKGGGGAHVVTATVAQSTAPAATPPAGASTPPSTTAPGTTGTGSGALGLGAAKPPKIPLTAATPKSSGLGTGAGAPAATNTTTTPASTTPSGSAGEGAGGSGGSQAGEEAEAKEGSKQAAILLDTNAASTYNPYDYPAAGFGDPSLAIDGDTSTAWTAQVNPANAPKMAQGLLINLKAKQKVGAVRLVTSTPGMVVQVYGANGHTAPSSITDHAWRPISSPHVVRKRHLRISLRDSSRTFTFITLWISRAPKSSTAAAPGHVSVNELELFPPRG